MPTTKFIILIRGANRSKILVGIIPPITRYNTFMSSELISDKISKNISSEKTSIKGKRYVLITVKEKIFFRYFNTRHTVIIVHIKNIIGKISL